MSLRSSSPSGPPSVEISCISVQLSYTVKNQEGAKGKKKKEKTEVKNKELAFTFQNASANYLEFLSTMLIKHGYDKYTPVTNSHRFGIKVIVPPNKAKKDAIDIDSLGDYKELIAQLLKSEPSKLTIFLSLKDVKKAAKRQNNEDSLSEEMESGDSDAEPKATLEKELARLRGILEKKWANPSDNGYTYITDEGERVLLTPTMMREWVRAIYDAKATCETPPNTLSFDPKTRRRSLFSNRGSSPADNGALGHVSTIIRDVCQAISGSSTTPSTPAIATQAATIMSPAQNTPSKLGCYLRFAEKNLGVGEAAVYEGLLTREGYGPDILHLIDDKALVACGLTAGDAIRLKRGASDWWNGPEAKRPRLDDDPLDHVSEPEEKYDIRFEKRFKDGGSTSVFGSCIVPGRNRQSKEFDWWYFNPITRTTEEVPAGHIPRLDPQYHEDNPFISDDSQQDDEGQENAD